MTEPFSIISAEYRTPATLFASPELRECLDSDGAALLRGCNADPLSAVLAAARIALGETYEYRFFVTPRQPIEGGFMSATDVPPARSVRFHNECSYLPSMPRYLVFVCRQPGSVGGSTLLACTRDVARSLPESLLRAFAARSVVYHWQLHSAEEIARKLACTTLLDAMNMLVSLGADVCVDEQGRLDIQIVRPAVIHVDAEPAWVNHVWALHRSALPSALRDVYARQYGPDYAPHDVRFADGSSIDARDLEAIGSAYFRSAIYVQWQIGDVLIIDNLRWAHAREPYTGTRDLCVALFGATRGVTQGAILQIIVDHLSRAGMPQREIAGLVFTQAGGDSMAAAEIIEAIRVRFGIDIPIARFFVDTSLRQLADDVVRMAK